MSPIYQTDDPFYRKEEADADPRDAEIERLREALVEASRLATMVANIIGQVDNWCPTTALCCVLNLNGIIKAAAQALAEPGGKP